MQITFEVSEKLYEVIKGINTGAIITVALKKLPEQETDKTGLHTSVPSMFEHIRLENVLMPLIQKTDLTVTAHRVVDCLLEGIDY